MKMQGKISFLFSISLCIVKDKNVGPAIFSVKTKTSFLRRTIIVDEEQKVIVGNQVERMSVSVSIDRRHETSPSHHPRRKYDALL